MIFEHISTMIYESPDGGKTIYARMPGKTERELVYRETSFNDRLNLWRDILTESEKNTALQDLVQKTEMLYQVVKSK